MADGRKPTPGSGRYHFPDTEEPTRPGAPTSGDKWDQLRRLFSNLTPDERGRLLNFLRGLVRPRTTRAYAFVVPLTVPVTVVLSPRIPVVSASAFVVPRTTIARTGVRPRTTIARTRVI